MYIGSGCPEGWKEFESLCYFYVDKGKMAMSHAGPRRMQAISSVIKSAKENDFLLSFMEDNGDPWLGMEASNRYSEFKRPPM